MFAIFNMHSYIYDCVYIINRVNPDNVGLIFLAKVTRKMLKDDIKTVRSPLFDYVLNRLISVRLMILLTLIGGEHTALSRGYHSADGHLCAQQKHLYRDG